jgi:hypothetical protein
MSVTLNLGSVSLNKRSIPVLNWDHRDGRPGAVWGGVDLISESKTIAETIDIFQSKIEELAKKANIASFSTDLINAVAFKMASPSDVFVFFSMQTYL